jgi:hypothetical protein
MNLEIFDVEQNTQEWAILRCGIPTASCFAKVLAQPRKGSDESKTRKDYMNQLADEAIYHDPVESYTNANMERGHLLEAEARDIYQLENAVLAHPVGFVRNHTVRAGCSPDSLIGTEGLLEIKTSFPRLWVQHVVHGTYPPEHTPQVQGALWVTGRQWCDLMLYWPKRRPHVVRIERDDAYIYALADAVWKFNVELDDLVRAMRTKLDLKGQLEASLEAAQ